MRHTENQIVEIGKKFMDEINWTFKENVPIRAAFESKEEQLNVIKDIPNLEQFYHKIYSYWIVFLGFPESMGISNNSMFLKIRDSDGVPVELSHKQAKFFIEKTPDGWNLKHDR